MKNWIFLLVFTAFMASCQNSSVSPTVTQGVWKVTYYVDSGKNETSKFNGYTFEFKSDGKFVATLGSQVTNGVWSENTSSNKLIISISGTDALDDASDDWLIIDKTATVIKLRDDNVSSGEEIHFTKN